MKDPAFADRATWIIARAIASELSRAAEQHKAEVEQMSTTEACARNENVSAYVHQLERERDAARAEVENVTNQADANATEAERLRKALKPFLDERGRLRRVLGNLPLTADGCILGDGSFWVVKSRRGEPHNSGIKQVVQSRGNRISWAKERAYGDLEAAKAAAGIPPQHAPIRIEPAPEAKMGGGKGETPPVDARLAALETGLAGVQETQTNLLLRIANENSAKLATFDRRIAALEAPARTTPPPSPHEGS